MGENMVDTDFIKKITQDAKYLGILKGDTLLVHSSYKALGTDLNIRDVIKGLQEAIGDEGTLAFPSFSYRYSNPSNLFFDIRETSSNVGAIPETFRGMDGVIRSACPTHSCCAKGCLAEELTGTHQIDETPCGEHSPFRKLMESNGKILMLGCELYPNTSMHAIEELVKPEYLFGDIYTYAVKGYDGRLTNQRLASHNFAGVTQRYDRIEHLLNKNELITGNILNAKSHLIIAEALWQKAYLKLREDNHYFVDRL
jgi:aminoglycoside 3-N-acetyltransferase